MKRNGLIIIVALIVATYVGCKREIPTDLPAGQPKSGQGVDREIDQKMYAASETEIAAIAQQLKGGSQLRLVADSVPIDSAIWVVEAALNYDLDLTDGGSYEFEIFTEESHVPADAIHLRVGSDDLEDAYAELGNDIKAHTDAAHKVKVIDVTASVNTTGTLTFTSQFAVMSVNAPSNPCTPATTSIWYYSSDFAMSISPFGPSTAPNARKFVEDYLNCPEDMSCTGRAAYSGISSSTFSCGNNSSNNSFPTALFTTTSANSACYYQGWGATYGEVYIGGAAVNGFITNMQALAYNTPAGTSWISCVVTEDLSSTTSGGCSNGSPNLPGLYTWGWDLTSIYGVKYCAPWPLE